MRVTTHHGRSGKDGAYSPRHNDRNQVEADHINAERSSQNRYWHFAQKSGLCRSFEQAEKYFYSLHFSASLNARNNGYKRQRHPERIKTIDQYRANPKTCPEETILQVGRKGDSVSGKDLWGLAVAWVKWHQQQYPQCKILDMALHMDEQGAPHVHVRKVWIGHDRQGHEIVSQAKALREMGLERPDLSKPQGRYNNAKQVYTMACRDKLIDLCLERGLSVEQEPQETSKSGLSILEYQRRQEEAAVASLRAQKATLEAERVIIQAEADRAATRLAEAHRGAVQAAEDRRYIMELEEAVRPYMGSLAYRQIKAKHQTNLDRCEHEYDRSRDRGVER